MKTSRTILIKQSPWRNGNPSSSDNFYGKIKKIKEELKEDSFILEDVIEKNTFIPEKNIDDPYTDILKDL